MLLLDRDAVPSNQVLATHTIHPPGFDVLEELGALRELLTQGRSGSESRRELRRLRQRLERVAA